MTDKNKFISRLADNPFLIMSHRGFWGGNIIQNTTQSADLAYRAGSDIVEVDVCRSLDGVYYLFHDGGELGLLGIDKHFSHLTSDFIDNVSVLNTLGTPSGYRIQRLSEFLEWLPDDSLVNIDRSWTYWNDKAFFDLLHHSGKAENLLLKSPVQEEWLSNLEKMARGIAYMPIVYQREDVIAVMMRHQVNLVGVEIVAPINNDFLDSNLSVELKQQQILIMANAEKLGEHFDLFVGLDDDASLFNQINQGWDAYLNRGIDIIQTDWPNFMNEYRRTYQKSEVKR
ncbi:glycerophosphodiester phosphodiesterase family protein [Fundicoccus culcitae]|uniref:Glycerophosphodiester phosphodiesterase family protein n=1 Tax=Fundicoccus culcitae TaxID=2969821 RepID=A0ABY5P3R2_9LACT|nr:glycerophosphodiester phosphodiesterase family protein [Fundicoccus culcitae]UUX33367.1 glycerophosphodiester phosphodiesterase family protein [Fundicoccus culcitae]